MNKQLINKEKALVDFIKALYGGIFIGIAGIVYLALTALGQPILGAILFGFGLFTILAFNFNLYTGKIGYLVENLPIILIGNLLAAAAIGFVVPLTKLSYIQEVAAAIIDKKINDSLLSQLILSIFCGILMYVGVEGYKKLNSFSKPLIVFLSISTFILCGFEHCIANCFYYALTRTFNTRIIINIIGNSIGSLLVSIPISKILDKN